MATNHNSTTGPPGVRERKRKKNRLPKGPSCNGNELQLALQMASAADGTADVSFYEASMKLARLVRGYVDLQGAGIRKNLPKGWWARRKALKARYRRRRWLKKEIISVFNLESDEAATL